MADDFTRRDPRLLRLPAGPTGNGFRGRGFANRSAARNHEQDNAGPSGSNQNQNNWRQGGRFRQRTQSHDRDHQNDNRDPISRSTNRRGNRGRRDDHNDRGPRAMGFRFLEELLSKDEDDFILCLMNDRKGFSFLCNSTHLTNDTIVLIVKTLKKVCQLNFNETKTAILATSLMSENFRGILKHFIACIPLQNKTEKYKSSYFWRDPDNFWTNLIDISAHLLSTTPTIARVVLEDVLKPLKLCLPNFEEVFSMHVADETKAEVDRLNQLLDDLLKQHEKKIVQLKLDVHGEDNEEPPDDFRHVSIYPTPAEIISNYHGFLRRNIVTGAYRDVDHYLDVQFRLLREDFVAPLRKGIAHYLSNSPERLENIEIHKRVRFLGPETVNEYHSWRILWDFNLGTRNKRKMNFENSKRFMFGSLLCFSSDKKFGNIFFGRVSTRNKVEDLQKGELIVDFDSIPPIDYQREYLMVECSIYFEPYYHVLSVLQNMAVRHFPMERYLIYVASTVHPPDFLTPESIYTIDGRPYRALELDNRRFFTLNESQITAFRAALTQDFTLIQGPPGTGKTFLGLKIAQTLLENSSIWYRNSPMLVICYTNHALDQFLEGLIPTTNDIIRVGGRSKNPQIERFNLMHKRKEVRAGNGEAVFLKRLEVNSILASIKVTNTNLKYIDEYVGVIKFDAFQGIVKDYAQSWFASASNDAIINWLLEDRTYQREQFVEPPDVQLQAEAPPIDDDDVDDEDNDWKDLQNDDVFDVLVDNVQDFRILISLDDISKSINHHMNLIHSLSDKDLAEDFESAMKINTWKNLVESLRDSLHHLKNYLDYGRRSGNDLKFTKKPDLKNPYNMCMNDRWSLYFHWVNLYGQYLREQLPRLDEEFHNTYRVYEELRSVKDVATMKRALVIGMTTTCAARLRSTLSTLQSPIMIVEEAAEVLEAHIIAALTPACKQLILIGDHQQLKPSTADFRVETKFNLGISLFERMVLNDIQCHTLNVQHRMRPEIASLIRPAIYPNLENHASVENRPQILGVQNCLYFIDHKQSEESTDGTSKKNPHETKFLLYFARHLILNGYEPGQITILAAYLGQMYEMQREKRLHGSVLDDVRISVLDNYQGEESDIVLLSLVRNNEERKVGFLKIDNRVCVALSRARNGMYIMGNMDHLCEASDLWKKVRSSLKQLDSLGPDLTLRCQVHDTVTHVKTGDDFLLLPEGGCSKKCEEPLRCGHICASICHILDRNHTNYRCREICGKPLCESNVTHLCRKMCYEECGPCTYRVQRDLKCGHRVQLECHIDLEKYECLAQVQTTLGCGHETQKPCYREASTFPCPHPCESKVEPCGHSCSRRCHVNDDPDHIKYKCIKPCAKFRAGCTSEINEHLCPKLCFDECLPCEMKVDKTRIACSHVYKNVACNLNVDDEICEKRCKRILECGHPCKNKCCDPCGNCSMLVEKDVPICGHKMKLKCSETPKREHCKGNCPLQLACGHKCRNKCNEPCTQKCQEMVAISSMGQCGHLVRELECWMRTTQPDPVRSMRFCKEPCGQRLLCDHVCSGTCGECRQGRTHKRCADKCGLRLICDHECPIPCREACRPCTLKCPYFCVHSKCTKPCGAVCTPCKEKCPRRCKHQNCTNFCGQICSVPACTEPCGKHLKCGHRCVGFCGDPCPPLCRICDRDELQEIFLGEEDEPDARFVFLNECRHVIENNGMENWLRQDEDNNTIQFKLCPRCKTAIKTTQRYSDHIKRAMNDVARAKEKSVGAQKKNENARRLLRDNLEDIASMELLYRNFPLISRCVHKLMNRLEDVGKKGRRQLINKMELTAVTAKYQILDRMSEILKDFESSANVDILYEQVALMIEMLDRDVDSITRQETEDMNWELGRLQRIMEFMKIKNHSQFAYHSTNNDKAKMLIAKIEREYFYGKYSESKDVNFKNDLKQLIEVTKSNLAISEAERVEIVKVIGLSKGHWFKCKNGHVYAIGECGGAMQESVCPECKAPIGGRSHVLQAGNSLASEMDGARYAAYSEMANNLANFNLAELNLN